MERAKVQAMLDILSGLDNPDEVAELLSRNNIKGKKGNPLCCPIAKLFREKVGGTPSVGVWSISYPSDDPKMVRDWYYLPNAVGCFINRFDSDVYPELMSS